MAELSKLDADDARNRLCELNVMEQVRYLARTTVVRDAWLNGQLLVLQGFVYGLHYGLINDLCIDIGSSDYLRSQFKQY
jgi:carbonic anhydrase